MLSLEKLSISFPGAKGMRFTAVRDVSFSIEPGEVLGLVGESGSGKSVTSLAMMRLLPSEARIEGSIRLDRQELLALGDESMRRIRGARIAMIFQEPMTALNPVMRVGDQVAEAVQAHHRISKKKARERAIEALREVALPEAERRARDYPHQLSGGMRQRVLIAMAIVNRPQLLIADEPTTALDVTIQAQILALLAELREKFKLGVLFISHDLAVVSQFADRVAVMYAGSIVESGSAREVFASPAHPYTRGLLKAAPSLQSDRRRPLAAIEGVVPNIGSLPAGCAFEPRCELRLESCRMDLPGLIEISPGHLARCPVTGQHSADQ
jgi:oligopeptide/dipeptide ABC transporter ATP-binding protein